MSLTLAITVEVYVLARAVAAVRAAPRRKALHGVSFELEKRDDCRRMSDSLLEIGTVTARWNRNQWIIQISKSTLAFQPASVRLTEKL
jgi:hypothetical protein